MTRRRVEAFLWAFMTAIAYPLVGWIAFGLVGLLGGVALGCAANLIRWRYMR